MAITEDQKRTTARIDLGGDALQALQDLYAALTAGGVVFDPTLDIGDVNLLNATGTKINPATEETLAKLAVDYVVSAAYTATITATAIIPTAFTATLPADLVRLVLIPRGDVYWKIGGAATASTALVAQASPLSLPMTKAVADTVEVYAAGGGVVCDLLVCTPR